MRKVLFKRYEDINGKRTWSDFVYEGQFHQWAAAYEEFESGPGNYTYAIIELADGSIETVLPQHLKFIS